MTRLGTVAEHVPEGVALLDIETGDVVRVHVADNGPGVPDGEKEAIFGKGKRGPDGAGTGLGLYLVRTFVEQFGGEVWVSDNDPEAAVFTVALPTAE